MGMTPDSRDGPPFQLFDSDVPRVTYTKTHRRPWIGHHGRYAPSVKREPRYVGEVIHASCLTCSASTGLTRSVCTGWTQDGSDRCGSCGHRWRDHPNSVWKGSFEDLKAMERSEVPV